MTAGKNEVPPAGRSTNFVKLCVATGMCMLLVTSFEVFVSPHVGLSVLLPALAVIGSFHLVLAACNWPCRPRMFDTVDTCPPDFEKGRDDRKTLN